MNTLYLILTQRTPQFNPDVVAAHYAFLDELAATGQLECAGPFTDQSGGAYVIRAGGLIEATAIAHRDPVYTSQSSQVTVHEWRLKYPTDGSSRTHALDILKTAPDVTSSPEDVI